MENFSNPGTMLNLCFYPPKDEPTRLVFGGPLQLIPNQVRLYNVAAQQEV
ncbi:hypothetical protein ZHAS_00006093 [Anopheles sinensis]|uniref:Uncharacterized protein n=1 Tax=Anopheles sinensis TaxID=74873 RepID=A0A084VL49_ANOSI|nr:hypothetical protein ZHAS_00006093 [Anopheles sinensis]